MVSRTKPQTLVKIATFEGDLEEAVMRFDRQMFKIDFGLGNTFKYAQFYKGKEPCLVMVSQARPGFESEGYNSMLSVTSYSESKSKVIAKRFEDKTGIRYRRAPVSLRRLMSAMNDSFQSVEKDPDKLMKYLAELPSLADSLFGQ